MFLSFIVPVYNARQYLEECLHSLLEQDIPDYEIICVNDGSTDGSDAVLNAFAAQYSQVNPIHQKNSGVASARNTGLAAARGDYIWFVDADDFIESNVLSRLQAIIAQTDCDQLVVGGFQFTQTLTPEQETQRREGGLPGNAPGPGAVVWRSLIRRRFLYEHDVTFRHPELTHGEDGQFLFELSLEAPACAEIEDTVYFYRVRSGSAETGSSLENTQKKLRSHIRVAEIMLEYYKSGSTDVTAANRLMSVLWYCLYGAAKLPLGNARQILNTLRASGLFPFCRPENCTLTESYMIDRGGFIGKIFDWVYMHLHTRWGFAMMWLSCHLLAFLRHNS